MRFPARHTGSLKALGYLGLLAKGSPNADSGIYVSAPKLDVHHFWRGHRPGSRVESKYVVTFPLDPTIGEEEVKKVLEAE